MHRRITSFYVACIHEVLKSSESTSWSTLEDLTWPFLEAFSNIASTVFPSSFKTAMKKSNPFLCVSHLHHLSRGSLSNRVHLTLNRLSSVWLELHELLCWCGWFEMIRLSPSYEGSRALLDYWVKTWRLDEAVLRENIVLRTVVRKFEWYTDVAISEKLWFIFPILK